MTATATFDIVKQLPETGVRRPEGDVSVSTGSTQKDTRRSQQSEASDFRANWQELLTSVRALEKGPGGEEALNEETGPRSSAGNVGIARRSFPGPRGCDLENEPTFASERSSSMSSQHALQIGQPIALGSRDLKTPKEMQSMQQVRASNHAEEKDNDSVKSEKHHASTLLADAQAATGLIASTAAVTSPIPRPSHESVKQIPSSLNPISGAGSESFDAVLPMPETKEAIHQAATSVSTAPGRSAGERGEEADGSAPPLFPADQLATSDDADGIANAPRPSPQLEASHLGVLPASGENHTGEARSSFSASREIAGQDAQTPQLLQRHDLSTPISERVAASADTADTALSKARNREVAPNGAAGVHTQPGHATHRAPDQARASYSQQFATGAMQDTPMMFSAGSRELASPSGSIQAGNAGPEGRELFTALDADRTTVHPTWIRTGTHEAEAGYQDPEIGWVTVRAHAEPSGVHASLVAGSIDAAQSLSGHLGGLNAYLADHHASVQHVSIAAPEILWGEQSPGQSMDHGTAQGRSQEQQSTGGEVEPTAGSASHPRAFVQRNEEIELQASALRGSRYISVVA
jgi:hypothetical protein